MGSDDALVRELRRAMAKALKRRYGKQISNVPPGPVMKSLGMVAGDLLGQLHHTPDAHEQFCAIVQEQMVLTRARLSN